MSQPGPPPPYPYPQQQQQQQPPPQQQHQNVGQPRQGQPGQLGPQNFQNGGQQKGNQGAQLFQNQYAPYDPQLAQWVFRKNKGSTWEPQQQHISVEALRSDLARVREENPSVQKTLNQIPSSSEAHEIISRLVQEETQRLQRENRSLEWVIAGVDLAWKSLNRRQRQLIRIELILKTQTRAGAQLSSPKMSNNIGAGVDPLRGSVNSGLNANKGPEMTQKGNPNPQFNQPQSNIPNQQFNPSQGNNPNQRFNQPQMPNPAQGPSGHQPPPPPPPPPPPVQHMAPNQNMPGPHGHPGQPPPPPNFNPSSKQQQQPQQTLRQPQHPHYPQGPQVSHQPSIPNIPGAFPTTSSQPSMRHDGPKHIIENLTAHLLKKQQSKSKLVGPEYEQDSDSYESDSDPEGESFSDESVADGYGYITRSRSASRSKSKGRVSSRTRDPSRGRVTKSYRDKSSHGRGSSKTVHVYPADLHRGRSVEKPSILRSPSVGHHAGNVIHGSPRSSKGALPQPPPVNVIINNPAPATSNRARSRDRRDHSDSDRDQARHRHVNSDSDGDHSHARHSGSDRERRRNRRKNHDSDSDHSRDSDRKHRGRGKHERRGREPNENRRYRRVADPSPASRAATDKWRHGQDMTRVPSNASASEIFYADSRSSVSDIDGSVFSEEEHVPGSRHMEIPIRNRRGSLYRSKTDMPQRTVPVYREHDINTMRTQVAQNDFQGDDYPGYTVRSKVIYGEPMQLQGVSDEIYETHPGQWAQRPQMPHRRHSAVPRSRAYDHEVSPQTQYVETVPQYSYASKTILPTPTPRYLPAAAPNDITDAVQTGVEAALEHMHAQQRQPPLRRSNTSSGRRPVLVDPWARDEVQYVSTRAAPRRYGGQL